LAEDKLTGAYASDDSVRRTQSSVVIYLDILGFTQDIREAHKNGNSDELLKRITGVVHDWYGERGPMRDRSESEENRSRMWEVRLLDL
jgi:hypothetical protein